MELVAPDGTIKTLHNREGDGTNDIIKTYTPNFDDDDDAQIQGDLETEDKGQCRWRYWHT